MIEPGQSAPDFILPDQDSRPVGLGGLRGRPVVLYFYPKAGTPGCTAQACGVRDHAAAYDAAGATVLGVSRDPVSALRAFADEHELGFPLLSDADHAVAEAYGAWVEKSMYGRRFWGVERTTFVIGAGGVVADVLRRVRPARHDQLALAALATLQTAA